MTQSHQDFEPETIDPSGNEIGSDAPPDSEGVEEEESARSKWIVRIIVLAIVLFAVVVAVWYSQRSKSVTVVRPVEMSITESISGSGVVGGDVETNVGAQTPGIVSKLYVNEGDTVIRGQEIALIKNDVSEAQILQARAARDTARAQLIQVSRGALPSDVNAAIQQVNQAKAQVDQQSAAVQQAEIAVEQANSLLDQLVAEMELARKESERSKALAESGDLSLSEYDKDLNTFRVAEKRVAAQKSAIEAAKKNVVASQSNLRSIQSNLRVQEERLQTIRSGARVEDITVAERRLAEADQLLRVMEEQAQNAVITAPFAGVVTVVNAELGQTVGSQGVVSLVSTAPEIRIDLDEGKLPELRIGQLAVISTESVGEDTFKGRVSELGAAVDKVRGTIEVKIIPDDPPSWLRPGQTINVSIITAESVSRLLVPPAAVFRNGNEVLVYVVKDGVAVERPVATRLPTSEGVPVLAGLTIEDDVITNPAGILAGEKVRVK